MTFLGQNEIEERRANTFPWLLLLLLPPPFLTDGKRKLNQEKYGREREQVRASDVFGLVTTISLIFFLP